MISEQSLEMIAKACHEANKAVCEFYDEDMPTWTDAEEWQREAAINGVNDMLNDPTMTPEETHDTWWQHKIDDGWEYGTVKDGDAKTHPCMVDYDKLPSEQQLKDYVFHAIVKSFIK